MKIPEGFCNHKGNTVCRLLESLCGLKQASRRSNSKLTNAMNLNGYSLGKYDYSIFTKKQGDQIVVLLLYVDDLVIFDDSPNLISDLTDFLKGSLKMKDLGTSQVLKMQGTMKELLLIIMSMLQSYFSNMIIRIKVNQDTHGNICYVDISGVR